MEIEAQPERQRVWKNKRRASLYVSKSRIRKIRVHIGFRIYGTAMSVLCTGRSLMILQDQMYGMFGTKQCNLVFFQQLQKPSPQPTAALPAPTSHSDGQSQSSIVTIKAEGIIFCCSKC